MVLVGPQSVANDTRGGSKESLMQGKVKLRRLLFVFHLFAKWILGSYTLCQEASKEQKIFYAIYVINFKKYIAFYFFQVM